MAQKVGQPDFLLFMMVQRCAAASLRLVSRTAISIVIRATLISSIVPLSFNVGLNDHIELFFKPTGYRGVKVNSPPNLSSFYLPNSQLNSAALCLQCGQRSFWRRSGPNVGTLAGTAVFRPANNQPFVQYPFVGGSARHVWYRRQVKLVSGSVSRASTRCSDQRSAEQRQLWSGCQLSWYRLAGGRHPAGYRAGDTTLPATAIDVADRTVPATFTVASDVSCRMRRSSIACTARASFNNFGVWRARFVLPDRTIRLVLVSFRSIAGDPDKADRFRRLQPDAAWLWCQAETSATSVWSMFVDGRLSKHVNVSANLGYILNSNPKGPNGDFVLLDRPDELLPVSVFDFPVNEHFQPIGEVQITFSTWVAHPMLSITIQLTHWAVSRFIRDAGSVLASHIGAT